MVGRILFLSLGILSLGATGSAGDMPDWGKVSDSEWALQTIPDYPDANAAILFDVGKLEVTVSGISFYRHIRIKVFNEAGAEEAGDVTIWYWDDDKIKDLKAHTITPDGKEYKVEGSDIKEQEHGDRRTKTFAFPHIVPGSILEYKFYNFNKRFTYMDSWEFHNDLYTLLSKISLDLAGGFVYSTAYNNVPGPYRVAKEDFDKRTKVKTFTWQRENLPPLRDEPYIGALNNYLSSIQFQMIRYEGEWEVVDFVDGWPELGEFFTDKIIKPYVKKDKGLDELVAKVTSGISVPEEKIRAVYRYVRDSIRTEKDPDSYFSNEKLEELLNKRVGTSDEKNILIVEMCKSAGINGWPTLISTRDHGIFNYEIYHLRQFNHLLAIIQVGQGGVLLDASSKFCPYGVLPPQSLVKGGFLLEGLDSRAITINPSPPESDRLDHIYVTIDDSGLVRCSTHTVLTGYFSVYYGDKLEKNDEESFVKDILLGELDADYELISHELNLSIDELKLEATMIYTSPELVEKLDGNLFLSQPNLTFSSNPFVDDKRFFPIDFTFPGFYHTVITYDIDSAFEVTELPPKHELKASSLEYLRQSWMNEDMVTVESKFLISEALLSPATYVRVRNLFEKMEEFNREQVVFAPEI